MKYISKSPTFFEYRVKISNIIKSQFKTSRFSERIEGEKFEWRCSVKILDLSFHAVYFSSVTTSANAKAVLRSLAFPRKARVLHTARRSRDLRPRTKMWRNPAIFLYLPFLASSLFSNCCICSTIAQPGWRVIQARLSISQDWRNIFFLK